MEGNMPESLPETENFLQTSAGGHTEPLPFRGSDLVNWLVERGLCAVRMEAERYGARLQLGGVLEHQEPFRDSSLLFHFTLHSDSS